MSDMFHHNGSTTKSHYDWLRTYEQPKSRLCSSGKENVSHKSQIDCFKTWAVSIELLNQTSYNAG